MAVPNHALLLTIVIDSLYTNIDTRLALQILSNKLETNLDPTRPDHVFQLIEIGLNNNDLMFNNKHFLQIKGDSHGSAICSFLGQFVHERVGTRSLGKMLQKTLICLRFLDNIFGIWTHHPSDFPTFIDTLNNHRQSIKVKHQINFLDTTVLFTPSTTTHKTIHTKVYFKPTDTHELLSHFQRHH